MTPKFSLVKKEKRRSLYLLPSYHWRLLALPNRSWTATQKPTPVYAIYASGYISPETLCRKQGITLPRASTVAQSLTTIRNFARISNGQESAQINAFLCIFTTSHSAYPKTGASARRSAVAKLRKFLIPCNISHIIKTKINN